MSTMPRANGAVAGEAGGSEPDVSFAEVQGGVVIVRGVPIPLRKREWPGGTQPDVEPVAMLLQVTLLED